MTEITDKPANVTPPIPTPEPAPTQAIEPEVALSSLLREYKENSDARIAFRPKNNNKSGGIEMSEKESCSVIINGKEFVRKDLLEKAEEFEGMPYQIVRTHSAGVFAGYVESRIGTEVVIRNARRLWYWDGAASLSQLAMEGVKKPDTCKFPCEMRKVVVTNAIELIDCNEKARLSIQAVKIWQM